MAQFLEKRGIWEQWLSKDPEHSIQRQLDELIFDHAVYRSLRVTKDDTHPSPVPPVLRWYLDKSYAANQFMGIRRLCEKDQKNDSVTIRRLLADMKENIHLFTRENFVCYDGAPFDPEPYRKQNDQEILERFEKEKKPVWSSYHPFMLSEQRHAIFDRVMRAFDKTYKSEGKKEECFPVSMIDKLVSNIGCCSDIEVIASKYHAHASDVDNRGRLSEKEKKITFDKIEKCHKKLCEVANFIGSYIVIGNPFCVPCLQFEIFEGFNKNFYDSEYMKKMEDRARKYMERYNDLRLFDM